MWELMDAKNDDDVETVEDTSIIQLSFLTKKRKQLKTSPCNIKELENGEQSSKKNRVNLTLRSDGFPELIFKKSCNNRKSDTNQCKNCRYCTDHCPPSTSASVTQNKKTNSKPIECKECVKMGKKRMFKSQSNLDLHIKYSHNEDESLEYQCNICSKNNTFTIRSKYVNHMMEDHQIQIYICDICEASFKLKVNYKNHIATHNIPSKKAFKCSTCLGTFVNKAGYDAHRKRFPGPHQKHVCDQCGVSLTRERAIKNHRCKKIQKEEAAVAKADYNEERERTSFKVEFEPEEEKVNTLSESDQLFLEQSAETEQFIFRELSGQIIPGTQILQFEVNDPDQNHQIYQVNVADWNMVTPFVIRDTGSTTPTIPQIEHSLD